MPPSSEPLIMLRTDLSIRLTGDGVLPFSPSQQTAFANALRTAFADYNFMSIVIGGFQVSLSATSMHVPPSCLPFDTQNRPSISLSTCVRACVRACAHACVCVCVCVRACAHAPRS